MENVFLNCLYAFLASLGFGIIFNIRGKNLFFASLGGTIGWAIYIILGGILPDDIIRYFIAAVAISFYSENMAKFRKCPSLIFLVVALIPLVPGYSIYKTMENLLLSQIEDFTDTSIYTFKVVMAISTGVLVSSKVISKTIPHKKSST